MIKNTDMMDTDIVELLFELKETIRSFCDPDTVEKGIVKMFNEVPDISTAECIAIFASCLVASIIVLRQSEAQQNAN